MDRQTERYDELLVDWHLDRLDESGRPMLKEAIARDPALASRSKRLGRILQPLDTWTVPPPPPNLVENVLQRVARERAATAPGAITGPWTGAKERGFVRSKLPPRDLIAAAACLVLLVGTVVPGLAELRYRAQRLMCSNNLASIFRGTSAYQATFFGSLPFVGEAPPSAAWLPEGAQDRPYASNSRHVFLLLKHRFGPEPKHFQCPSGPAHSTVSETADLHDRNDFERASEITYAMLNLAGPSPNLRPAVSIAYAGDLNPLFVNARFNAAVDPDHTNSPAHRARGQSVLTLDGAVHWLTTPIYEPTQDNVWLAGDIRHYVGVEAPVADDDAQLVPGFPETDPAVIRQLSPNALPPAE